MILSRSVLEQMLAEIHHEILEVVNPLDVLMCFAKRDALAEMHRRMQGHSGSHEWVRKRPVIDGEEGRL